MVELQEPENISLLNILDYAHSKICKYLSGEFWKLSMRSALFLKFRYSSFVSLSVHLSNFLIFMIAN